jgi:hypothetical protein
MPGAGIGLASEGRSKLRGEAPSEPGFPGLPWPAMPTPMQKPPCRTSLDRIGRYPVPKPITRDAIGLPGVSGG